MNAWNCSASVFGFSHASGKAFPIAFRASPAAVGSSDRRSGVLSLKCTSRPVGPACVERRAGDGEDQQVEGDQPVRAISAWAACRR